MQKFDHFPSRRKVIAGLGFSLIIPSALVRFQNSLDKNNPVGTDSPRSKFNELVSGDYVPVDEILSQEVPQEYLNDINQQMKGKTGVFISKNKNLFFLYKNGVEVKRGVAMHANANFETNKSQSLASTPINQPNKPFSINRMMDLNYRSNETKDMSGRREKMYHAMFYDYNGRAIHGSDNFETINGVRYARYNNSHGCINVSLDDIIEIKKILKIGSPVFIQD